MQSGRCRQTKHEKNHFWLAYFLNFQINSERGVREREKKIISTWKMTSDVEAFRSLFLFRGEVTTNRHRWLQTMCNALHVVLCTIKIKNIATTANERTNEVLYRELIRFTFVRKFSSSDPRMFRRCLVGWRTRIVFSIFGQALKCRLPRFAAFNSIPPHLLL